MVEIKIEPIDKKDINLDKILSEISKEMSKKMRINKEQMKSTKTPKETPSLEKMKKELEMYKEMANTLTKQIKEEEQRRKKNENHLIEKKIRTITMHDNILSRTRRKEYTTSTKEFDRIRETIKYIRRGNKIICTITNDMGVFQGIARQHPEDKFDYEDGMTLAMVRAKKDMYTKVEEDILEEI